MTTDPSRAPGGPHDDLADQFPPYTRSVPAPPPTDSAQWQSILDRLSQIEMRLATIEEAACLARGGDAGPPWHA